MNIINTKTITNDDNLNIGNKPFEGLRVAITGGTSGLGLALVRQLRSQSAQVAFIARGADKVAEVVSETGSIGIVGDVGQKDETYELALQLTANLGGVDVLVNNASTLGSCPLTFLSDTPCEEIEHALAVNVLGAFRLSKALFGALAASAREERGAIVVNISSDAAINAYESWGAYGLSKAALRHMSAIWNEETSDLGIRFLSIDPGDMDTPPIVKHCVVRQMQQRMC